MSEYPVKLETAYTSLSSKKNLPELFCRLFETIQSAPPETYSPETIAKVQTIFQDVNSAVQDYNRQFQMLVKELGILCKNQTQSSTFHQFFSSLLDLFRLAYTVYKEDAEALSHFEPLLQKLLLLLQTNKIHLEQENTFQNALLLQLVKSAWALTNTRETMEGSAKEVQLQQGGKKTRKAKRRT